MSTDVIVRPSKKEDEQQIVELLKSVFNSWPHFDLNCSSLDHWRWKYNDNPLRGKVVAVAESDGKIVGCSHGLYLKAKIDHTSDTIQQGTDLAILKDYRGMGLYPKMTSIKNESHKAYNANYSFGLSTNPVVERARKKRIDPKFHLPLKHMIKILDTGKHFRNNPTENSLIKQYGYASLKTLNKVKNATNLSPTKVLYSNLSIKEPAKIDERVGEFWNQIKEDYNFIVERDNNFINWRYRDERGGKYTLRYAYENDTPMGYAALRVNRFKEGYPEGYIVDLLTSPDRQDIAEALIRDANQFFEEKEVNIIHAIAIKGHPNERILSKFGYLHDRNRLLFSIRSIGLQDNLGPLFKSPLTKIHFNYGDSDWI